MYSKELIEKYVQAAALINGKYGPWTLIAHFILVAALLVCVERTFSIPGRKTTILMSVALWVTCVYGGVFLFLAGDFLGIGANWLYIAGYFIIGALLALPGFFNSHLYRLSTKPIHRIAGLLFMVAGAALYPLVEILTGLAYPGIVLIGAECPTFIFLIGLLIASLPSVNKVFASLVLSYGLISSLSAVWLGVYVDIIYLSSCLFGIGLLIQLLLTEKRAKSMRSNPIRANT